MKYLNENALVIGSSAENPLATISEVQLDGAKIQEKPVSDSRLAGLISQAISCVPDLAVKNTMKNKKFMEVVINNPLSPCADGNGFRGFARGEGGKFIEHGRFFNPDGLQNAVNFANAFNAVSFLVAQKHLADIDKKLVDISKGIAEINDHLREQRFSVVTGAFKSLREIGFSDSSADHQRELVRIDRIWDDLIKVMDRYMAELVRVAEIRVEHKEWFGSADYFKDIDKKAKSFESTWREAFEGLKAMSFALIFVKMIDLKRFESKLSTFNEFSEKMHGVGYGFLTSHKDKVEKVDSLVHKIASGSKYIPALALPVFAGELIAAGVGYSAFKGIFKNKDSIDFSIRGDVAGVVVRELILDSEKISRKIDGAIDDIKNPQILKERREEAMRAVNFLSMDIKGLDSYKESNEKIVCSIDDQGNISLVDVLE